MIFRGAKAEIKGLLNCNAVAFASVIKNSNAVAVVSDTKSRNVVAVV